MRVTSSTSDECEGQFLSLSLALDLIADGHDRIVKPLWGGLFALRPKPNS